MRVLIACEFSGTVRRAFRDAGHDAWSCDILPAEDGSEFHIQDDVLNHLCDGWDMMIAHPPCTYLANSGVRWLHEDITRWPKLFEAAAFFRKLLHAPIPLVIIENPIMHKYAATLIGQEPVQTVQPWMFGDNETKAVCLWVHRSNDILLTPHIRKKPDNVTARVWRMAPGPERQKERSRFFPGIAKALAEQLTPTPEPLVEALAEIERITWREHDGDELKCCKRALTDIRRIAAVSRKEGV